MKRISLISPPQEKESISFCPWKEKRVHDYPWFNLLMVWRTGPKLNQTNLMIYILHPKPPKPTNFQNQFNLDCNIILAKPSSNPRFHPMPTHGFAPCNSFRPVALVYYTPVPLAFSNRTLWCSGDSDRSHHTTDNNSGSSGTQRYDKPIHLVMS